MKILLIHHKIPYPFRSGWDKTIFNLIRTLSKFHQITFIAPAVEGKNADDIEHVRKLCHSLICVPVKNPSSSKIKNKLLYLWRFIQDFILLMFNRIKERHYPEVAKQVSNISEKEHYDLVQATSLITAPYLIFANSVQVRVVGPVDDSIESARTKMLVETRYYRKLVRWVAYRKVLHYQPKVSLENDWILFYSELDLKRISDLVKGLPNARHIPIAVEVDEDNRPPNITKLELQESKSLVFVGTLGPPFNQDAVLWFCQDIFPLILREVPEAKFYIVGENPPAHIKRLSLSGKIIVTGEVPDVRPYIEPASVYVAPIRAGTGLKTKIIEALSMGKAIVATSVAVAGLWDLGDKVIHIHDDPEDFAKNIVALLRNDKLRIMLGLRARQLFERSYSFEAVAPRTLNVYSEIEKSLL